MRVNGVGGSGDSSMGRDSSASMDASSSALLLMNIGLDRTALRSMAFWAGDLMSEPGESVSYTGLDSTDSMSVVGGGVFASSCVEGFEWLGLVLRGAIGRGADGWGGRREHRVMLLGGLGLGDGACFDALG